MGRLQKKGSSGEAAMFITRSQAIKRLQVSLPEFRKLCILKGVYPREPKRKLKGRDKTYYYTKDIAFLAHDPILAKIREQKTWSKRITKAQGRKESIKVLKRIESQKPTYSLVHIIRERYPSFNDALRDLDDALCTLHLFAQLITNSRVSPDQSEKSRKLSLEFQSYVIRSRALRKVFLSIKGIYYQVEIFGEKVTWIVPYQFSQEIPQFVDLQVMLNFLEFYQTLVGFVNYKLFHSQGLYYPPQIDVRKLDQGEGLFSVILEKSAARNQASLAAEKAKAALPKQLEKTSLPAHLEKKLALAEKNAASHHHHHHSHETDLDGDLVLAPPDEEDLSDSDSEGGDDDRHSDDSDSDDDDHVDQTEEAQVFKALPHEQKLSDFQNLFKGLVFFLSREVPKESLEFVILAFGGKVSWEGELAPFTEEERSITHQIVDRENQPHNIANRDYVQPQWVYDCINAEVVLPVKDYGPRSKLPPHLSPFVDDEREGYTPKRAKEIAKLVAASRGEELEQDDSDEEDVDSDSDDDEKEERYAKELHAERKGVSYQESLKKSSAADSSSKKKPVHKLTKKELAAQEEEQRKQFAQMMIPSRRKRRLYERIKYTQQRKEQKNSILAEKAQKISAETKKKSASQ